MSDINPALRGNTKRAQSAILRGMAGVTQKRVAELVGISESVLSEWKSGQLERCAAIVAACGLRLVPCTDKTFSDEYIAALRTLSAIALDSSKALVDEDGE